jgi:hypothetical protein
MTIKYERRLAFSTKKTPKFGRGVYSDEKAPRSVSDSPFYWWFRFLKLNNDYALAVHGKSRAISQEIITDFGDISNIDFKTWWKTHAYLFAEEQSAYQMTVANKKSDLAPFNHTEVINLVVPLTWSNVGLKRRFAEIINKYDSVQRVSQGLRIHESTAKYKIGRRWNTEGFKNAHSIYVQRQKSLIEQEVTGKKVMWPDIAIRAKIPLSLDLEESITNRSNVDLRRSLSVIANRHYKNALKFIKDAASFSFPK